MAAHIRINEVSREPAQTITYPDGTQSVVRLFYIDVDFWATRAGFLAGNPPLVSNDFRPWERRDPDLHAVSAVE